MIKYEAIHQPIEKIKSLLSEQPYVMGIFILGSTFEELKKIDLFILIKNDDHIEKTVQLITEVETIYPINPDIWSLQAFQDQGQESMHAIFKEAKLIYWNAMIDVLASQIFKVRPMTIFTFEFRGFDQKDKVRYNYQLYGKNNNGLLSEWTGRRLGKSCFIVPYANKYKVTRYFNKNNIKYDQKEVYI